MVISPVYASWVSFGRLSRTLMKFGMDVFWLKMRSMGGSPAEVFRAPSTSDPNLGPRPIKPWPSGEELDAVISTGKGRRSIQYRTRRKGQKGAH